MEWEYNEEHYCWNCGSCGFELGDMFDDEGYPPYEFGFYFCPNCGERLYGKDSKDERMES